MKGKRVEENEAFRNISLFANVDPQLILISVNVDTGRPLCIGRSRPNTGYNGHWGIQWDLLTSGMEVLVVQ